ncbi:MAG TPA: NAD-dependent epimerase/dehydratase family protein [Acetobacteraceae bacterium]|nr:NAD-dependent epimerase/dehydratase family protein [Acetobacteraceae bacterium]
MASDREQDAPRVLIIGASGFVGASVALAAASRHDLVPVACMRHPNNALSAAGIEQRTCDATDSAALTRALRGVSYAVNCVLGNHQTMLAVTRNLCAAATQVKLRRIVHISSMAVYGKMNGTVDEASVLNPATHYARAKAACEAVVQTFISAGGDAVILRPACVYGPGGEQWVGRICRWLCAGRVGLLGELGEGTCNLTFNEDLASAVVAALTSAGVNGQAFNIADSEPGTWNQYFLRLGHELGVRVPRVSRSRINLETTLLAPPLQIAKLAGQRLGFRPGLLPEPIPPSVLSLWRQHLHLNCRKAHDKLQSQQTPLEQGLRLSASWFRSAATH